MFKIFSSATKLACKLNPVIAIITTAISVAEIGKKVYDYVKEVD